MKSSLALGAALMLALSFTACGTGASQDSASPGSSAATAGFPAEVKSCTETLTFEQAPERILVLSETDFAILYALGVSDKVVARAGVDKVSNEEYPEMRAALDKIPTIEAGNTGTGGAKITVEAALEVEPDLVIGYDAGIDREQLRAAGVPLYSPDAFCESYDVTHADWDLVDKEIDKLAAIFGVQSKAEDVKNDVDAKLSALETSTAANGESAIALFLMNGSQEFYAYGTSSMVQPIFEANGLVNMYEDTTERVFDASMEAMLDRNPDWIVVLVSEMSYEDAEKTLLALPGANDLKAVQNNQVVYMPFVLTDPPTTLSVMGAERLGDLVTEAKK